MRGETIGEFPANLHLSLKRKTQLRYGETLINVLPFIDPNARSANVVSARQLSGEDLSYNNLLDLDSALGGVRGFGGPAASVMKHNNPCGAATGEKLVDACRKALAGDPLMHLVLSGFPVQSTPQLPSCCVSRTFH